MTSDVLTLTGLLVLIVVVLRVLRADGGAQRRAERRRSSRRLEQHGAARAFAGQRRKTRHTGRAPARPGHGPHPAPDRRDGRNRRVSSQVVAVERRLGLERRRDQARE